MVGGTAAGFIAGLIGAAIWAAIAYYLKVEIGWIAWIIGGMVGFATAMGARDMASAATGAIAAIIAVASIAGGKYFVVNALVNNVMAKMPAITFDDNRAKLVMADQVAEEWKNSGKTLTWPPGKDAENADVPADYPADLWKDVEARWNHMNESERETYKQELAEASKSMMNTISGKVTMDAYWSSFDWLDIVFAIFAIITAFKVGSGDN